MKAQDLLLIADNVKQIETLKKFYKFYEEQNKENQQRILNKIKDFEDKSLCIQIFTNDNYNLEQKISLINLLENFNIDDKEYFFENLIYLNKHYGDVREFLKLASDDQNLDYVKFILDNYYGGDLSKFRYKELVDILKLLSNDINNFKGNLDPLFEGDDSFDLINGVYYLIKQKCDSNEDIEEAVDVFNSFYGDSYFRTHSDYTSEDYIKMFDFYLTQPVGYKDDIFNLLTDCYLIDNRTVDQQIELINKVKEFEQWGNSEFYDFITNPKILTECNFEQQKSFFDLMYITNAEDISEFVNSIYDDYECVEYNSFMPILRTVISFGFDEDIINCVKESFNDFDSRNIKIDKAEVFKRINGMFCTSFENYLEQFKDLATFKEFLKDFSETEGNINLTPKTLVKTNTKQVK